MKPWLLMMNLPLLALLLWAAITDLRFRRIPNWLTLALMASGLIQGLSGYGLLSVGQSAAGMGVGFALPLPLFLLGAIGGGDVKLLAGVGAWVGPHAVLLVFAATAILGGIIILLQSLWLGRARILLRNTGVLIVNLLNVRRLGVAHVQATGQTYRTVQQTLPYAVPMWIATVMKLCQVI
jgi:prepilin peptidase CpaA